MRPVRRLQRKIRKERLILILPRVEEADEFVRIKLVRVNLSINTASDSHDRNVIRDNPSGRLFTVEVDHPGAGLPSWY